MLYYSAGECAILLIVFLLSMSLIIGLVGDKLGGKDAAGEYLAKRYNGVHLRYSEILDEILELVDEPVGRDGEMKLARALRSAFNENILGQGILKRIRQDKEHDLFALNGIRYPSEVPPVKALGGRIVYITAPVETRYERYRARQEKADDGTLDFEEFRRRDSEASNEVHIAELGAQAELRIDNIGTIAEFHQQLDDMVARWR
jgi:dephospho-CoA kinase